MYLLLLIIVSYMIYYKYNQILEKNNLLENFNSNNKEYYKLNKQGIKIETPVFKEYNILTNEKNTTAYYLGIYLKYIIQNIKLKQIQIKELNKNKDKINENTLAICHENDIIENPKTNISFICGLNKLYIFLIVHNKSNIKSFTDLKNKTLGINSIHSSSFSVLQKLCDLYNIELSNNKNNSLNYSENDINTNFNLFLQNKLDGLFYVAGNNIPYILSLSKKTDIRIIDIDNSMFDKIEKNKFKKITLNIENYNTLNNSIYLKTYYTRNVLICSKNTDEEIIYNITKYIFEIKHKIKVNMYQ